MGSPHYESHIIQILVQFYTDLKVEKVYHKRWDLWLISRNYMDEYFYLIMLGDQDLKFLLAKAELLSKEITDSPLYKLMKDV